MLQQDHPDSAYLKPDILQAVSRIPVSVAQCWGFSIGTTVGEACIGYWESVGIEERLSPPDVVTVVVTATDS